MATSVPAASLDPCAESAIRARYADLSERAWVGARVRPTGVGKDAIWMLERVIPGGVLFYAGARSGDVISAIEGYDLPPASATTIVLFVEHLVPSAREGHPLTLRLIQQQERVITVTPRHARPSVFFEIFGLTLLARSGWQIEGETVSAPLGATDDCLSQEIARTVSSLRGSPWLGTGRTRLLWADGSSHWELSDIVPGGPLDLASIREGDSVIGIDGIDLTKHDGPVASPLMRKTVGGWKAGQVVALRIRRGATEFDTTLTVGETSGSRLASRMATLLPREANIPYAEAYYQAGGPGGSPKHPPPPGDGAP